MLNMCDLKSSLENTSDTDVSFIVLLISYKSFKYLKVEMICYDKMYIGPEGWVEIQEKSSSDKKVDFNEYKNECQQKINQNRVIGGKRLNLLTETAESRAV